MKGSTVMTKKKKIFSEEEQKILASNPFTLTVTETQIRFTVEFKQFILDEREKNGTKWKEIFRMAGYDPKMIGQARLEKITEKVRREAASPKGLHETASRKQYSKENERTQTKKAIKQLQDEILRLQQQIEFLKKTQMLDILLKDED